MISLKPDLLLAESCENSVSLALLALKRFIRGVFRQVSIGLLSLAVILNLGIHPQEPALYSDSQAKTEFTAAHSMTVSAMTASASNQTHRPKEASQKPLEPATRQAMRHILSASLTHHHLTSARLSIPTASHSVVVSAAKGNGR